MEDYTDPRDSAIPILRDKGASEELARAIAYKLSISDFEPDYELATLEQLASEMGEQA